MKTKKQIEERIELLHVLSATIDPEREAQIRELQWVLEQ